MPHLKRTRQNLRIVRQEIQRSEEQLVQAEKDVLTWLCSASEQECPHSDTIELLDRLHSLYKWSDFTEQHS